MPADLYPNARIRFIRLCASLWKGLASVDLSLVLCLLLAADAVWGYLCIHRQTAIFIPLNDMGLWAWAKSWGGYG